MSSGGSLLDRRKAIAHKLINAQNHIKNHMKLSTGFNKSSDYPSTLGAGMGGSRLGRPRKTTTIDGGKRNGWKAFTHDLGRSIKSIGYDLSKPLGKAVRNVGTQAIQVGEKKASEKLAGMGRIKTPRVKSQKMEARGILVKSLMNSKGMTLPQASKYIKEHNLKY